MIGMLFGIITYLVVVLALQYVRIHLLERSNKLQNEIIENYKLSLKISEAMRESKPKTKVDKKFNFFAN